MKILYSPQVNTDKELNYSFDGEEIMVKEYELVHDYEKETTEKTLVSEDTFDFSGLPNGELEITDEEGNSTVETELSVQPILMAKKTDGTLEIELLNYIGVDATEEECFPDWFDTEELED